MQLERLVEKTAALADVTGTTSSATIDLDGAETLSVQCVIDVDTPAAAAFTAATTDICTAVAHGFPTGLKGQASTTTTLPAGLATTTDYFVIALDADTFSLAASLADALAGTAIDITDTGTGTHTFTPTALAGATVTLEKSNDGDEWDDVAAGTAITADAVVWFEKDRPTYRFARVTYTLTAGSLSTQNHILVKG